MKQAITWHKHCLENQRNSVSRMQKEAENLKFRIDCEMERIAFREKQIQEAEKRGLKEFDADKLLVKRNNK